MGACCYMDLCVCVCVCGGGGGGLLIPMQSHSFILREGRVGILDSCLLLKGRGKLLGLFFFSFQFFFCSACMVFSFCVCVCGRWGGASY